MRSRPLLSLVVLVLLCAAVAAVIGAILGAGLVPAVGLSAAILGDRVGSYETMLAITQGYGGASHAIAALLGGGLLWALAVSLIAQVYLRGLVMLHQRASEDLDAETTEDALMQLVGGARRRASAWGERARAAAMPERNPAPPSFTAPLPASHAAADSRSEARRFRSTSEPDAGAATDPPVASTSDARIEPTWGEAPAEADELAPSLCESTKAPHRRPHRPLRRSLAAFRSAPTTTSASPQPLPSERPLRRRRQRPPARHQWHPSAVANAVTARSPPHHRRLQRPPRARPRRS